MNAEQLHDAISLLPADLITEADRKRSAPRKTLRWQRYAAMAACLLLMLGGSSWCLTRLGRGGAKDAAPEEAAAVMQKLPDSPAAAAPEMLTDEAAPQDAAPAAPAADSAAAENSTATAAGGNTACFAAVPEITVSTESGERILAPEDRAALAQLLSQLTFRKEDVCECIAEITVTVNGEETFRINLEEGFVRCERGQAKLTQAQIDTLREIFYPAEED